MLRRLFGTGRRYDLSRPELPAGTRIAKYDVVKRSNHSNALETEIGKTQLRRTQLCDRLLLVGTATVEGLSIFG